MICARENHPMQQLGRKFGAHFTLGQGEALGEIAPDPATAFSLWGEAMHDTTDFVTAVLDWSRARGKNRQASEVIATAGTQA
jgi:hypothetical protein